MPTLANAILQKDFESVRQLLRYGEAVNQFDEYGFLPLSEAAIIDSIEMTKLLLDNGADPKAQDSIGGTALHWAVENNNLPLCELLLKYGANPNAYNFAGQPVLVSAILRQQSALRQLLVKHGADIVFAQDYINTKLVGHLFELVGTAAIVDPNNQYVEVDFEGFYLEVTLGLVADSLAHFYNHFAARELRRYAGLARFIVDILLRAAKLTQFQQYRVDITQHQKEISQLLKVEPLLIPVAYEGHAITFIKFHDIWIKCDRREDSRLYDNIMFYRIRRPDQVTEKLIQALLYKVQSSEFINETLDRILTLEPITELKIEAQISGNCSWANVEAVIPAVFLLMLMETQHNPAALPNHKTLALNFFHRWREWNKERTLHYCIQSYREGDAIRKASKAEMLAAILFQRCDPSKKADRNRIEAILALLIQSPYEYILQNYLRIYYYESNTEEGKRFAELLREHGYLNRTR